MRILSAISLIILGLFISVAVITYDSADLDMSDWFLPAPHPVDNLAGPFGAWLALRLHNLMGYYSLFLGLVLIFLGLARFFRWPTGFIGKYLGISAGWTLAVGILITPFTGDARQDLMGKLGNLIGSSLDIFGSVGKFLVAFAVFGAWFLFATGIGFTRPALAVYNVIASLAGLPKQYARRKKEKELAERRKLIEEHRRRQEQIHRQIAMSRTGKIVPGSLPEEILVPPGKEKTQQVDLESSQPTPGEESPKVEELHEISPGLTDEVFTPPPIIRTESRIANQPSKQDEIIIESETTHPEQIQPSTTSSVENVPPPPSAHTLDEEGSEEEEIIVSPPPEDLAEKAQPTPQPEVAQEDSEELPPWLLTDIPPDSNSGSEPLSSPPSAGHQDTESERISPKETEPDLTENTVQMETDTTAISSAATAADRPVETSTSANANPQGTTSTSELQSEPQEEMPQVNEPEESPGEEIEPAVVEDEGELPPEAIAAASSQESSSAEGELVLKEKKYIPPPIGLLHPPERPKQQYSESQLQEIARKLYQALKTFNVDGKIVAITPGPVITRFEFEPAPGIKISKIVNLADDIALALKTSDVRIVAPLPGKGTVGIEIPNQEQEIVYIRSVIESQAFQNTKAMLPLALGKKVAGEPVVADLAKMPHLLIAGATGSGKSVCINAIITSLIYKKKPTELRLLMIDPKRLELSIYNGIPFLISPVIVENKEASAALKWALLEMERRYKKLAEARVRKLEDYNKLVKKKPDLGDPLPYIVIIIDELADLMMTVASEIEEPIARLAQMARAVGIHLIIATQRPSVDVVTGIIKANFPSRIAFKVRSKIDSRTILDMSGAERLLGHGDMLYLPTGFADPIRIHGSYVSTEETENIVEYLKQFENPQVEQLSFREVMAKKATEIELDDLFWEAAKIVVMSQKGSASHLQRKLRIGYTRAASIIDQLEAYGIVGPFEGSRPREVLIKTLEELDKLRLQMGG